MASQSFISGNELCAKPSRPSALWSIDEPPRHLDGTVLVQIVVASLGKPNELLRLTGKREQSFAKADRDGRVSRAVHDQEGNRHARNPQVRAKRIPDQPE